jgi:hypothetical protein
MISMSIKEVLRGRVKQACTMLYDPEMHDAIEELRQAEAMFNNASEGWRQIEASYRILAAEARIQAIRIERGETIVEKMA